MEAIIEKLKRKSAPPWNFAQFMETALYESEIGYYNKHVHKLGTSGDFYTSNHVNPVFAETFARFFADVIETEKMTPSICEWGAGDGTFAYHALTYFQQNHPEIFKEISYIIIESSTYHRDLLVEKLADMSAHVTIYESFTELKRNMLDFEGVIFSNELVDAFPVHVIEMTGDGFKEVKVDEKDGALTEILTECNDEALLHWVDAYGPDLPAGYRTEICPAMKKWLEEVSDWLKKGLIVTVDYGYKNSELRKPERKDGSIRGYKDHEMINNPLLNPGEMDLTAHVQWDAYNQIAEEKGLEQLFHSSQDRFLLNAGLFTFLQEPEQINPFSDEFKKNRAIQSLVHPGGISSSFQVAVHSRQLKKAEEYKLFNEDPYQIKKP